MFEGQFRHVTFGAALAMFALAACGDNTDPGGEEPDVASMVVTVAGNAYTADASGFGSQTAAVGAATVDVSAVFLTADGEPDQVVLDDVNVFELSVAGDADGGPLPAGVTFTRTGAFTGTLAVAAGQTAAVWFGLLHIEEQHNDFGPFPLQISRP